MRFSLGFLFFFFNEDGCFSDISARCIYGFPGFPKDVASRSHSKTIISSDHLQLEKCMTSLVQALITRSLKRP